MQEFDLLKAPLDHGTKALIEANAGTGKTWNIQNLYLRLLLEQGWLPAEILVVTFTEAATAELRDRIRANIAAALAHLVSNVSDDDPAIAQIVTQATSVNQGKDLALHLRRALAAFDEAGIFTIHGFCQRSLTRYAFDTQANFDCELKPPLKELIRECVVDFMQSEIVQGNLLPFTLNEYLAHATLLLDSVDAIEFGPETSDVVKSFEELRDAIKNSALPKNQKKIKEQFADLQSMLSQQPGIEKFDTKTVEFLEKIAKNNTAKRDAPALVDAISDYLEQPKLQSLEKLRDYLRNGQHGFAARKSQRNLMEYNDLLTNMREALKAGAHCPLAQLLRQQWRAALIDEFQDTDSTQFTIFRTIFDHPDSLLYVIGDPKQAIYGFRGGDIHAYLAAREGVDPNNQFSLSQNYRSAAALIEGINTLFNQPNLFGSTTGGNSISYQASTSGRAPARTLLQNGSPATAPLRLLWCTGDDQGEAIGKTEAEAAITKLFVAKIAQDLSSNSEYRFREADGSEKALSPGDIAILVVTHKQAATMQRHLRKLNIPSVIYKSGNIFASEDAQHLYWVLKAMLEPNRPRSVKAALLTPWCGITHQELPRVSEEGLKNDDGATIEHADRFAACGALWHKYGVLRALTKMLEHYDSYTLLAQLPTCERRITNLRHLSELVHQKERTESLSPPDLLKWLQGEIDEPNPEDELHEQRMESDSRAVTILTIHKSKGLQFPLTYLPYLCLLEVKDPTRSKHNWVVSIDTHGSRRKVCPLSAKAQEGHKSAYVNDEEAENMRLLYVAMTRAEHACTMMVSDKFNSSSKPIEGATKQLVPSSPSDGSGISVETFSLTEMLNIGSPKYRPSCAGEVLVAPPEAPALESNWSILSYSGMVQHGGTRPILLKPDAGSDEVVAEDTSETTDSLKGGTAAGLCLHAILEQLDFTHVKADCWPDVNDEKLIKKAAIDFGVFKGDLQTNEPIYRRITELIGNTLRRALPTTGGSTAATFALTDITKDNTRREWEFYFNVPQAVKLDNLKELGLSFRASSDKRCGVMTGSIDLLFRHGERYWFADWKSDNLVDYSCDGLEIAMRERNYLFQAIVYAVALHKHLQQTLGANYDFEKHFGGGLYYFVRGITDDAGLYTYRPTKGELEGWVDHFK